MEKKLTNAKRAISTAETFLKKADREWAYYKNGSPHPAENESQQSHYQKSQSGYMNALKFAQKDLDILKTLKDISLKDNALENRAQTIIKKCSKNK